MLNLSELVRIYVCLAPTDMRKSFDTLAALVRDWLGYDPLSGHLFVFLNRYRDRVKILFWDRSGYCLYYKRLEAGTFRLPVQTDTGVACCALSLPDLTLMLEGIDLSNCRRRKRFLLNAA